MTAQPVGPPAPVNWVVRERLKLAAAAQRRAANGDTEHRKLAAQYAHQRTLLHAAAIKARIEREGRYRDTPAICRARRDRLEAEVVAERASRARHATTDVRPGQVWADCDPRKEGRTITVTTVSDGYATCTVRSNSDTAQALLDAGDTYNARDQRGKQTRILVDHMDGTQSGFRLIGDAL